MREIDAPQSGSTANLAIKLKPPSANAPADAPAKVGAEHQTSAAPAPLICRNGSCSLMCRCVDVTVVTAGRALRRFLVFSLLHTPQPIQTLRGERASMGIESSASADFITLAAF
ncbi:hypothetical protein TGAM01_v208286 [Trichoderma gamsii]|uniref:Uncharacterized protein n=1 Tax=Trichoderma gamsii TaxID=398673 RepID=A0A2P4ZET2_9HYPO|nr:hypothetical protein TGAM01_v208286 [Trichoderma gamsii]PON22806.1 hypothetical protein TGAM01_v208286 [Trichoderma gamsii]